MIVFENITFSRRDKPVLKGISFSIGAGERSAIVGGSGEGKTTILKLIMGLIRPDSGSIIIDGEDITTMNEAQLREVRMKFSIVFQEGALFDSLTVGENVAFPLREYSGKSEEEIEQKVRELLRIVGMEDAIDLMPEELSGGMNRRAAIARSLAACQPKMFLYDEPTSALDPSIQAQIMELLRRLKRHHRLAMLLISHSLALVSEVSERVAVLYHGRLVEYGRTHDVFRNPVHPYTSLLLDCHLDLQHRWNDGPRAPIAGASPPSGQEFSGCSFAARCPFADLDCSQGVPQPREVADGHWAACIHQDENRLKRIHGREASGMASQIS